MPASPHDVEHLTSGIAGENPTAHEGFGPTEGEGIGSSRRGLPPSAGSEDLMRGLRPARCRPVFSVVARLGPRTAGGRVGHVRPVTSRPLSRIAIAKSAANKAPARRPRERRAKGRAARPILPVSSRSSGLALRSCSSSDARACRAPQGTPAFIPWEACPGARPIALASCVLGKLRDRNMIEIGPGLQGVDRRLLIAFTVALDAAGPLRHSPPRSTIPRWRTMLAEPRASRRVP